MTFERDTIMKISIIGGGGLVGSMRPMRLQCGGVGSQHLLDRRQQGRRPGHASNYCTAPA